MRELTYLFFNLLVFVPVLILSFTTDVKPHRHWRALLGGYLLVSLPFILWDAWAVHAGHWGFNSSHVMSSRFIHLPIEEILFFFTVPFAMMYVWGVVKKFVADRAVATFWPLFVLSGAVGSAVALLVIYRGNGYTTAAMCATLIAAIVVASSRLVFTRRFWVFQLALFGIFVLANWFLTALPIITYNDSSIIGTRILTIPLEDFFFNFAFVNLFLVTFNWLDSRTRNISK
jgi:lycopene cyclase domain-containing protein